MCNLKQIMQIFKLKEDCMIVKMHWEGACTLKFALHIYAHSTNIYKRAEAQGGKLLWMSWTLGTLSPCCSLNYCMVMLLLKTYSLTDDVISLMLYYTMS